MKALGCVFLMVAAVLAVPLGFLIGFAFYGVIIGTVLAVLLLSAFIQDHAWTTAGCIVLAPLAMGLLGGGWAALAIIWPLGALGAGLYWSADERGQRVTWQ